MISIKKSALSILAVLWFTSFVTMAQEANGPIGLACGDAVQITQEVDMYTYLDINGDYIAWATINEAVKLYQISTQEEITLLEEGDGNSTMFLKFTEDYLFYIEPLVGTFRRTLETGNTILLSEEEIYISEFYNETLFWRDGTKMLSATAENIESPTILELNTLFWKGPFLGEDMIYWMTQENEKYYVYYHQPSTGVTTLIDELDDNNNFAVLGMYVIDNVLHYTHRMNDGLNRVLHFDPTEDDVAQLLFFIDDDGYIVDFSNQYIAFRQSNTITLWDRVIEEFTTIQGNGNVGSVGICQRAVYWSTYGFNNDDIYGYDLLFDLPFTVGNDPAIIEFLPHVDEHYMIYAKGDAASDHIMLRSHFAIELGDVEVVNSTNGEANGAITIENVWGAIPPLTVSWTGPDNYTASSLNIEGLAAGEYIINVTDIVGCNLAVPFILEGSTNVNEFLNNKAVSIYPNPSSDQLFVEFNRKDVVFEQYKIFDHLGQQVLSGQLNSNRAKLELNIQALGSGLFTLVFENEVVAESIRFIKM